MISFWHILNYKQYQDLLNVLPSVIFVNMLILHFMSATSFKQTGTGGATRDWDSCGRNICLEQSTGKQVHPQKGRDSFFWNVNS